MASPGQSKIALQGAANRPRGALGRTLFSMDSMVSRDSRCMPLGALIPFSNCQEAVIYRVEQCISTQLFLWFAPTLARELDSCHCTHCSWNHCFRRVSRVPVNNQSQRESRLSARVAGLHVNKGSIIHCFQGNAETVQCGFPQYLRDS